MTFADKLKKFDDKYLYTVYKELIELSITGEFPVDSHYLKDLVYLRAKLSEHDFNMLNFKVELLNEIARRWTEDLEKCFDNTSSNNPKECFMYLYQCLDKKDREKLVDSWLKAGGKETMPWWQWCMENINVSIKLFKQKECTKKKEIIGYVKEDNDNWGFDNDKESYSSNVPTAIDELLGIDSQDGDKFRITIEKLN